VSAPAAPDSGIVLSATDLVAGYLPGIDILRGCCVEVREGQVAGVIGPNGAGKSTLVKAIFGLAPVRSGTVQLHGEDITGRPAHALVGAGIGYVPQLDNVFPRLTVAENLQIGGYLSPRSFGGRFEYVTELFPALAERRNQRAGSLSGGERQMVAMARALMMEPSVLLLDEPSAGLSPQFQAQVFEQVERINAAGVAVLMVEQNARRCLQICDHAFVLDQGRNAYTGGGEELLHDPKVIELYLGTLAGTHRP
jgi:branched-chain amino acid transport system ATP-binding protein